MKTHFWSTCIILIGLFLTDCATTRQRNTYVTLDGDVVAPSKHGEERPTTTFTTFNETSVPAVWPVILEGNNPLIRKTLWEVGNQTCYQVTVPKQEMVTIMACWFDERGNQMSKEWAKITRQTLSSGPLELHIKDAMLHGKEPQRGIIINMRPKTIECWDNTTGQSFVLKPRDASPEIFVNAGDFFRVCWREVGSEASWQYCGIVDGNRDKYTFRGYLYDWTLEILNKTERCGN